MHRSVHLRRGVCSISAHHCLGRLLGGGHVVSLLFSAARCLAMEAPMPFDAPVTTATFPSSFPFLILGLSFSTFGSDCFPASRNCTCSWLGNYPASLGFSHIALRGDLSSLVRGRRSASSSINKTLQAAASAVLNNGFAAVSDTRAVRTRGATRVPSSSIARISLA